jgi:hypothetical protein
MAEITGFQWVTAAVALWGAGLSSFLAWRQIQRDRRRLQVRLSFGVAGVPGSEGRGIVSIDVANAGHRPVEVRQLYFLLPDGKQLVFLNMETTPKLPHKLDEGQSISGMVMALDFAHDLMRHELGGTLAIRAACRDGLGTVHTSQPVDISLAALAELG